MTPCKLHKMMLDKIRKYQMIYLSSSRIEFKASLPIIKPLKIGWIKVTQM